MAEVDGDFVADGEVQFAAQRVQQHVHLGGGTARAKGEGWPTNKPGFLPALCSEQALMK